MLSRSTQRARVKKESKDYTMQLRNVNNMQYIGSVDMGSQELPVIYDTGSWELIVLSTLCARCTSNSPVYEQRHSKTFGVGDAYVARHVFGSGDVLGKHGLETVVVGNASSPFVA